PDQISAAYLPVGVNEHRMLTSAQEQTADDTPIQGIERDAIQTHQAIGARIVADAATRPELWAGLTVFGLACLDGLNCLGACAAGQLRAQSEPLTSFTIHPMMGSIGVRNVFIPAHSRNPCGSRIERLLSRSQCRLMAVNVELDADSASEYFVH
ncbi:MAG TPA: hypothetical protein VIG77_09070, partial [Ktedonobacterales bacterium]